MANKELLLAHVSPKQIDDLVFSVMDNIYGIQLLF